MCAHRVAITGIGVISPYGGDAGQFFERLLAGESAVRHLHTDDLPKPLSTPFVGCTGFDPEATLGKPLALLCLATAAGSSHFMLAYGVVIDPSMMANVLNTDAREATDLLTPALPLTLLLVAGPALWWIWRRPLRRRGVWQRLWRNTGAVSLGLALAVASGSCSGMKCPAGTACPLTTPAHCACHRSIGLNMRLTTPRLPHRTKVSQAILSPRSRLSRSCCRSMPALAR